MSKYINVFQIAFRFSESLDTLFSEEDEHEESLYHPNLDHPADDTHHAAVVYPAVLQKTS